MSTVSRFFILPSSISAPYAVTYCIQIAAASSHESEAGCFTTIAAGASTSSP